MRNIRKSYNQKSIWPSVGLIGTIIGTLLAVIVIAFQLGQYFGAKNTREKAYKNFTEYLDQIKSDVQIIEIQCKSKKVIPGDLIEIYVNIENNSPFELSLWIGATARGNTNNVEIWNKLQDRMITLSQSGITSAKRYLTFPNNIEPDTFDLVVNLWYGKLSDPSQSVVISSASLLDQIQYE